MSNNVAKDFTKYVGGKLLTLRGEKSQAEVSKAIDISRQALGTYENGERTMDIFTLKKISEYYNVSTDYLLGLTNSPFSDKDKRYIQEETGLAEKSIEILCSLPKPKKPCDCTDYDSFRKLIDIICKEFGDNYMLVISLETLVDNTTSLDDMMSEYNYLSESNEESEDYDLLDEQISELTLFRKGEIYELSTVFERIIKKLSLSNIEQYSIEKFENNCNTYYREHNRIWQRAIDIINNNAEEIKNAEKTDTEA